MRKRRDEILPPQFGRIEFEFSCCRFDQPFQKLQTWQGKPEFDESSQAYAVQVSVPVLDPKNPKQAIGVLVVGINLTQVASPKPPAPAPAPAK